MRVQTGNSFYLQYRKNVKRETSMGGQEEVYQCEDCSGCPYAEQCKKTDKNRNCTDQPRTYSDASGSDRKISKASRERF